MGREDDVHRLTPVFALAHALGFALAGWAILQLVDVRDARGVALWAVGALLLHDVVLVPAYTALDRIAQRLRVGGVAAVNFVRVPAVLSGLSLLVYWPTILGEHDATFARVSGTDVEGALERWLALTAILFAGSALLLAVRLQQLRRGGAEHHDGA